MSDEGTYSVPFSATLTAFPDAVPFREYIEIVVTVDKAIPEQKTSIAWYLLPIVMIVFLIIGIIIGRAYQKRKDDSLASVGLDKGKPDKNHT